MTCFQFIPMPVLYGVFLYMGASSLRGIQVKRFLFFIPFIVVFVGVEWLNLKLLLYSFSTASSCSACRPNISQTLFTFDMFH